MFELLPRALGVCLNLTRKYSRDAQAEIEMFQLFPISALPVQPHRHLGEHRPLGGVFRYLLLALAPHPAGSRHVRRGKHMHVLVRILTYLFYKHFLRS